MRSNLISGLLAAFFFPFLLQGQTETYSVSLAKFSSKKYDEFSPVYYHNGIVFCSNRITGLFSNYLTPDNKGVFKINYVDTSQLAVPGKVRLFSRNLTSRFNDGPASFSRNKDTVYFSRNIKVDGSINENSNPRNKLGIFTAILENDDWAKTTDLRFNNEYYNITTPFISPDGKRLYFASDNPGGHGGSDLYYCQWKGDFWDDPVNLGPEINTSGNESYPYVNSEGALFFSSDGLQGLGGKDIFYTRQSGDKWMQPVPLDAPINSKYDDFALIADSVMNGGYFSSNRGGTNDIYKFKTRIHQLYYCENEKINQYCFKFTDEGKIAIDTRTHDLIWSFGDGTTIKGSSAEHCFSGAGKYVIKLDVVDKKTGEIFFSKLSYTLELKDFEQPIITGSSSGLIGEQINFDGISSYFPGSDVLYYTWYFGDGGRKAGEKVTHSFRDKGDYEVKLGLIVRDKRTGIIRNTCVSQPIRIFSDKSEKTVYDKKVIPASPRINIFDYNQAKITNLYSAEKDYSPDVVFNVEVLRSKIKLGTENKAFTSIPASYRLKEIFIPGENIYSYIVDEELNLMSTYPALSELRSLGFKNACIRIYVIENPAAKELNNLKRVFGVSADAFFRKNDFILTPEGTQFLDLILGFLAKYPSITLEVANHTDNIGTAVSNQVLTQKRSESMVNYLVSNGVNATRLVAKGYGESRPVALNFLEADRKLNRRVDFVILKE